MLGKRTIFGKQTEAMAVVAMILVSALTIGVSFTATAAPACENIAIARFAASGYETANPSANAIDNNLRTRWSNYGLGSWITADLGQQKVVCSVDIAWYKGNVRTNTFVVAVSDDGIRYTNVYNGQSSGKTTSPERYSFAETAARYVKITVNNITNGNNHWVSITEIDVNGYTPVDVTAPTVRITIPADGSTIAAADGSITVQGTASDDTAVSMVEVRVDSGSYIAATPRAAGDWSTWSVTLPVTAWERRLVPRATDSAGNQAWNSIYVTVTDTSSGGGDSGTLDRFGVEKLYPTASGGNEWYVNMDDPRSDPNFRNLPSMTRQPDGSWRVSASQVRMEAWSPSGEKWLNVEITGYAKMVSGSNELVQWYSRGGHHTSSNECLGSAYKARLYGDGEARWVKEVTHPAYTSNRGAVQATTTPLEDRWIGFKAVMYNFVENGRTYVRMESYIDDDVTDSRGNLVIGNNWELASVVEDRGGWSTTNSDFNPSCAPMNKDSTQQYRQRDEILNLPGGTSTQNIAAWRSDGLTWNWKYLSVREIVPT